MDFGTMRAKLHEGMYKNLQQFEYDVFLIFGNALHFNSSTTVYFRQARALEDLAKKIFFVLKSDPEKFILKYSATKQKLGKRLDCELSGLPIDSSRKLARESGPNVIHTDHGQNQKGGRRQSKTSDVKDHRSTYQTWMCLKDEARSTITHAYDGTKSLINANQANVGYEESLLLFVKDLGVTAHKVAKNKLLGLKMTASPIPHMNCWNLSTHHNNVQTTSIDSSSCGKEPVISVEGNFSMSRPLDTKTTKVAAFASYGTCIGKDDGNMRSWVASNSTMPPPGKELHADKLDLNHMPAIPSLTPLLNGFKDASMKAKVMQTSGLQEALKLNHVDHGGSVNTTLYDNYMITATANNNIVPLSSISSQPMFQLPFPLPRVRDEGMHCRSGINSKPTTLDISCPVSTKICGSSSDGYVTYLNGLYHHHHHHHHHPHTCWKDQQANL